MNSKAAAADSLIAVLSPATAERCGPGQPRQPNLPGPSSHEEVRLRLIREQAGSILRRFQSSCIVLCSLEGLDEQEVKFGIGWTRRHGFAQDGESIFGLTRVQLDRRK